MITTSIIIPTFHRFEALKQMLVSLKPELKADIEVIIIEQSRENDNIDKKQRIKELRKIINSKNLIYLLIHKIGMTHANNIGVRKARGKFLIFFDDDIKIHKDCIGNLLVNFTDASVGAVGGRVITVGQREEATRIDTGKISLLGSFSDGYSSTIRQEIDTVVGCNWAIRKDLFDELNGFDEQFTSFGIREESDLCLRIKKKGLKIIFEPRAVVTHERISTGGGRKSEGRLAWYFHYFSNETYFFLKHRLKILLPIFLFTRWNFALRCMFGFGREISVRSFLIPLLGIINGIQKYL